MVRVSVVRSRRRIGFSSIRGPLGPSGLRYSRDKLPFKRKQEVKQVMLTPVSAKSEGLPLKPLSLPEFEGSVVRTALTKAKIIKSEQPLAEKISEQESSNLRKIIFPRAGATESVKLVRAIDSVARNLTDAFFQAKKQFFLFENRYLGRLSSHGVNLYNLRGKLEELWREQASLSREIDFSSKRSSLSKKIPVLRVQLVKVEKAISEIGSYLMERDALMESIKDSFLKSGGYFSELLGVKVDELVSRVENHARDFRLSESKQVRTPEESGIIYGLIVNDLKEALQQRRQELLEQRRKTNIVSLREKRKQAS